MRKITALRSGRGQRRKLELLVDVRPAFGIKPEAAAIDEPRAGEILSGEKAPAATDADQLRRCTDAALGYLSYRPRSEAELRQRLGQRGFSPEVQDAVIAKLTAQKLLNDPAFAQFWKDNRERFRPQSQRLTRLELKRKGVADDVIDRVVKDMDDEASAYHFALGKSRQLAGADYMSFRRRLGGYLQRRGFSSSVIRRTLERIWKDNMGPEEGSHPGLQQKER